jgi:hypothetical protein
MATKPAADKKAAAPTEDMAGAAPLLCVISGTINGPVDNAMLGGNGRRRDRRFIAR